MTGEANGNERMEQRIETLLRQSEDFRRHGEDGSADAALALAEKIMLKHSIDQAVIAARLATGNVVDEVIKHTMPFTGIYRKALVMGFANLVRAYTTTIRPFISTDSRTESVHMVGFKSEIEQLAVLITSLHLQALGRMNKWWTSEAPERGTLTGMEGYKARRQYVISFIAGATERVAVARRNAVDQAVQEDAGTALALRSRKDVVDAFVAANFNLHAVKTSMSPGPSSAAQAGYRDGQQANTGERPIRSDRRQLGR